MGETSQESWMTDLLSERYLIVISDADARHDRAKSPRVRVSRATHRSTRGGYMHTYNDTALGDIGSWLSPASLLSVAVFQTFSKFFNHEG